MYQHDRFLQFQGFHPSEFTRSYLDEKISAIQDEAPFGAKIKAVFTRENHLLKGVVMISSSAGRFFAIASGNKVRDVTHRLTEQTRKQFKRWKSRRSSRKNQTA